VIFICNMYIFIYLLSLIDILRSQTGYFVVFKVKIVSFLPPDRHAVYCLRTATDVFVGIKL
jgi:hypothetical protein